MREASGEARVVSSLTGGGGGLGGPVILPSKMMGKGCRVGDQAKMIKEWCRGKKRGLYCR